MKQLRYGTLVLVAFVVALTVFMATDACARGGGGGGSGGGGGGGRVGGGDVGDADLLALIVFSFCLASLLWSSYRITRKSEQISSVLRERAERDELWSEVSLKSTAQEQFFLLQKAWGDQDLSVLEKHMFPEIYVEWADKIKAQIVQQEKNVLVGLELSKIRIVDVKNYIADSSDEFTVALDAKASDQTFVRGELAFFNDGSFREFWTFGWHNGQWLLKEVTQSDGWRRFVNAPVVYEYTAAKKKKQRNQFTR